MDPTLHVWYGEVIERASQRRPIARAIEVGGRIGDHSLLIYPALSAAERYCVNLEPIEDGLGIHAVQGNANDMSVFESQSFDLVVSNAMIEHDPRFWLSVREMRRILAPGGLLMIGAPGFVQRHEADGSLPENSTLTYKFHTSADYYRFSPQIFREMFFKGFSKVRVRVPLTVPPRIVGTGRKPQKKEQQ